MGLLAFLADKDACAVRMAELQAMADAAGAEIAKAADAVSKASSMKAEAEAMRDEVAAAKAAFGEKLAAVEAREKAVEAAVADGKALQAKEGDRLAAWANDLDQRAQEAAGKAAEFDARESKLVAAEKQAAAMRADYEDRIKQLRALAA